MSAVIEILKGGPIRITGLTTCYHFSGELIPCKEEMYFCRCGASQNKPFCDGSHRKIDFSGERLINKPLDKERSYAGKRITIHDNRTICSHAKECVNRLPAVFRFGERPWIQPDAAGVDEIIDVVTRCPSGALSYSIDEVHYRDHNREPAIFIAENGPYNVTGGIKFVCEGDVQPPIKDHYSLCRCGASKNKPFCDGSHVDIDFKDSAEITPGGSEPQGVRESDRGR